MRIDVIGCIRLVQKPDRIGEWDAELRSGKVVDRPPGAAVLVHRISDAVKEHLGRMAHSLFPVRNDGVPGRREGAEQVEALPLVRHGENYSPAFPNKGLRRDKKRYDIRRVLDDVTRQEGVKCAVLLGGDGVGKAAPAPD